MGVSEEERGILAGGSVEVLPAEVEQSFPGTSQVGLGEVGPGLVSGSLGSLAPGTFPIKTEANLMGARTASVHPTK